MPFWYGDRLLLLGVTVGAGPGVGVSTRGVVVGVGVGVGGRLLRIGVGDEF